MDVVPTERALVFGCSGCGGMWLDKSATEIVKWAGLHSHLFEAAAKYDAIDGQKDQASTHTGNYRQSPKYEMPCPLCRQRLVEEMLVGHLAIDRCPLHGTFFDRRELQALSVAAKSRRDLSADEVEDLLGLVTRYTDER